MKKPLHIFVLIDALGAACRPAGSLLADRLPYRRALRTVLGFSSGAVPTILSGQYPAQTGHWNLFYYDPCGSPFRWLRHAGWMPDALLEHRVTRKLLKETGRKLLGLGPLFECSVPARQLPLFNFVEKRNIYAPGGITGAPSIFDLLEARRVPYRVYTYHHYTDAEVLAAAAHDVRQRRADVYFLYLSEMDGFLHFHVGDEAAVTERLQWYQAKLAELFELADTPEADLTFSIFSDHGMTPVTERYDLAADIESLGLKPQRDYLAVYDSTMARFWFFNPVARAAVIACLQTEACGRILSEIELRANGVYFPDQRFGELVFLMHPGWLIAKSHFNGGRWNPSGMHGYHPDDFGSSAIFFSNRERPGEMGSIADIFPALRESVEAR